MMMMMFSGTGLSEMAWVWLGVLWSASLKGALLLTLVGVAVLALRRASAAERHLLWALGIAAFLALPLVAGVLPAWKVGPPLLEVVESPESSRAGPNATPWAGSIRVGTVASLSLADRSATFPRAQASGIGLDGERSFGGISPVTRATTASMGGVDVVAGGARGAPGLADGGPAVGAGGREGSAEPGGAGPVSGKVAAAGPRPAQGLGSLRPGLGLILALTWALGAALGLGGIMVGLFQVRRLQKSASLMSHSESLFLGSLAESLGIRRRVRLFVSPLATVPMTWGWRSPAILLPAEILGGDPETLRQVFLHELAHIKRHDQPVRLMASAVTALHWFNPFVWVAARRLVVEQEQACDDQVLQAGSTPSVYAESLLAVARGLRMPRIAALSALPMARKSNLSERLRAILDPRRTRGRSGWGLRLGSTLGALALVIPLAALAPRDPDTVGEDLDRGRAEPATITATGRSGQTESTARARITGEAESVPSAPAPIPDPTIGWDAVSALVRVADESLPAPERAVDYLSPPPASTGTVQVQEICVFRGDGRHSSRANIDDDRWDIEWSTDDCSVELRIRGEVEFAADDASVERMDDGAYLDIEERIGRARRRVRIENDGGRLERRYWVDRDERAFDQEAERWLAAILPELFRHTTINAEARVRRILSDSGVDGVLQEVERIHSDHVARTYLDYLVEIADLSTADVRRTIDTAGRRLDSDHHLAEFLLGIAERDGLPPEYRAEYLQAASTLESDHHHRNVLETLIRSGDLDADARSAVLLQASELESDHHLAEILQLVAAEGPISGNDRSAFLEALGSLESDHHHRNVIEAFLDAGTLSSGELARVLDMTEDLGSDHHRAAVLVRIAENYDLEGAALTAFLRSSSQIESDHNLRESASAVLGARRELNAGQVELVLDMASGVASDHHRGGLLLEVLEDQDLGTAELDRLLEVAGGIESDHQLGLTLSAVVATQELDDEGLLATLEAAGGLGADHQRSEFLSRVARDYDLTGAAREAYLRLAEDMSSRLYRDRAVAALVRRR